LPALDLYDSNNGPSQARGRRLSAQARALASTARKHLLQHPTNRYSACREQARGRLEGEVETLQAETGAGLPHRQYLPPGSKSARYRRHEEAHPDAILYINACRWWYSSSRARLRENAGPSMMPGASSPPAMWRDIPELMKYNACADQRWVTHALGRCSLLRFLLHLAAKVSGR